MRIARVWVRRVARWVCWPAVVLLAAAVAVAPAVAPAAATSGPGAKTDREWLDIEIFTDVPEPGHPEGILVAPNGTVYVATHQRAVETPGPPSKIFAYDRNGEFLREYVIEGQELEKGPGLVGMGMDADGLIYVIDRYPYRIITIDPATGEQQDYASFRDVQTCSPLLTQEECSESLLKRDSLPDDLTFAADGTMYVTDVRQNLIWRVPRGGGEAEVWFTDTRLDSVFGPNGIEVMPDGETLMFVQSFTGPFDGVPPRPDT
jgi:DNA-binding beta-propeller fold protein YncE